MSTLLSLQLKKLATPQTSVLAHDKRKASILFSAAEAATLSKETYYEIGVSGFTELTEVNDQFCKFRDSLFGLKTKEFQRLIETKDANRKLDKVIEEFLLLLSPYIQKQSALKALEWLIHRFLINELNVNALMMCIFPYYETILFVRILQVINIEDDLSPWHWMHQSQIKGRPLPKATVYLHWTHDVFFRNFLSKYFRKMVKVHANRQSLQIAASLLISTQMGGLESSGKIKDDHIASICQTLQLCFEIDDAEILSGTILMLCRLVASVELSEEFLEEVLNFLLTVKCPSLYEHIAICIVAVFYHQSLAKISESCLIYFEENKALLSKISQLAKNKSVCPFMSQFIHQAVVFNLSDENRNENNKKLQLKHQVELIQTMPLHPNEASTVICSFLKGVAESVKHLGSFKEPPNIAILMKQLESSHPAGFDMACSKLVKDVTSTDSDERQFERMLIQEFQNKWNMQLPATKAVKKIEIIPSINDLWLECFIPRKLPGSSKEFLRSILASIELSEKEKEFPFWQISKNGTSFDSSLMNMVKTLKFLIIHQIYKKNKEICSNLLKELFKVKLGSMKYEIYFLSMIYGWQENDDDIGINSNMKLWALNMTAALLKNPPDNQSVSWVADAKEPVLISLILPICEGGDLSKAAFSVLDAINTIVGGWLKPKNFMSLARELLSVKGEILKDVRYLPSTIAMAVSKDKRLGWEMVEGLLSSVLNPKVPRLAKSSVLYTLTEVHNPDIFRQLIPFANTLLDELKALPKNQKLDSASSTCLYYILLRFTSSDVLEIEGAWKLMERSLEFSAPVLQVSGETLSPQELVTNYKLLQMLSKSNRLLEVLQVFLTRIVRKESGIEASKLNKELSKISLEASQIISLWNSFGLISRIKSVKEARAKQLKLKKNKENDLKDENWRKFGLLIELVGTMENLKEPWLLIAPICDHLQALKLESSVYDTLQQKILSVCYHLLKTSSNVLSKEEFIKKCKLNVALIVQCIRNSVNPDTHRRALLILAHVSNYFPHEVLHNIMAIFTFMGTSLLRRDDSYSFHVIHLTISSIVPVLIQVESSDPKLLLKKLCQVTKVFVDALPDLAEHRRLPLFKQLATTLGVSQYLWLVMVLIADAYVAHGATPEANSLEDDPRRLPRNIHFALVLYRQFSVMDQLKASCEVITFICNLPEDKDCYKEKDMKNLNIQNTSTLVIDVQTRSSRQLRQLKYTCVGLLLHLISSQKFIDQVYEVYALNSAEDLEELKSLYKVLLEKSLQYLKFVISQEKLHEENPNGRFWSAMQRKLMCLVDSINSLLPPMLLVEVLSNLLSSKSDMIRCRAMEMLASKLQPDVKFFNDSEIEALVTFVDLLKTVGMDASEPENNRQTALFTLQLLIRRMNSIVPPDIILPALESTTKLVKEEDPSTKVITQALLVVAEAVQTLKVHSLVHLDKIVPTFLSILKRSVKEGTSSSDNLVIATVIALGKVVENLPRLLSRENLKKLFVLSSQLISKQEEENQKESRLTYKLTNILEQLVHSVELRILIPVISETYQEMSGKKVACLPSLMSFVESLIKAVNSSNLVKFKEDFIRLFLIALDARSCPKCTNVQIVEKLEECVNSALIRFLLKLNEDDNITIYTMLLNWAWDHRDDKPTRLITFFKFSNDLVDSLKVLFVKAKLAAKVFDHAVQILERNNNIMNKDTVFGSGEDAEESTSILLRYVLEMLTKVFLFDSVQFTNRDRFNAIVEPLADQIENTIGSEEDYHQRISVYLKKCMIKFTQAVGDDSLWKELNRQILLRIRSDNDPKVILAGLEIFEGLAEALGEDYLQPLLADTIPYITETLESFDEDVEKKSKEVFTKMETILGDSLRAYLDT